MTISNALLTRWTSGYVWVEDATSIAAYGRREGYLSLGAAGSVEEATRVGRATLNLHIDPRVAVQATLEPTGTGDEPYVDFDVADYVTFPNESDSPTYMRVHAIGVTETELGDPIFVPDLQTMADENEKVVNRWLKRMSNGSLAGTSESASPVQNPLPQARLGSTDGYVFSQPGPVQTRFSGRWTPAESRIVTELIGSVTVVGTADVTIAMLKNDSIVVESITTLVAGTNEIRVTGLSVPFLREDYATVVSVVSGDGGSELVITLRATR